MDNLNRYTIGELIELTKQYKTLEDSETIKGFQDKLEKIKHNLKETPLNKSAEDIIKELKESEE